MKVRAIIPNERGNASSYWRIMGPLTALRKKGIDAVWYYHEEMNEGDYKDAIVIIHRLIPGNPREFIQKLYKRGAKKILYSVDDFTFNEDVLREYLVACGGLTTAAIDKIVKTVPQHIDTMRMCDDVIVTTHALRDLVREVTWQDTVLLPNAIDENWFLDGLDPEAPYRNNGDLIHIGYASGRRPKGEFAYMAKAWGLIANEFPNVRFVVAGFPQDEIDREIPLDRRVRIPWQPIEQYARVMQVDIGCCPVTPNIRFNQGKSPIKWMEYTLAGATVVASSFYASDIIDGMTGYVTNDSVESWYNKLKWLIENEGTRRHIQEAAYYEIHNYRSIDATVHLWLDELTRI